VPDAIRRLSELSERLNIKLEERARLDEAVKSAQEFKADNERLKKELAAQTAHLNEAQSRLKNLEGDTFVLAVGKTRFVLGKELALGVTDTNRFSRECAVQLGDRQERIRPGKTLLESRGSLKVSITLLEVVDDTCRFAIAQRSP